MFECRASGGGREWWGLEGELRGVSRRWQHRLGDELWVWWNEEGEGVVWGKDHRVFLRAGMFAIFGGPEGGEWKWTRLPGRHRGWVWVVPREELLAGWMGGRWRDEGLAAWLRGEATFSARGWADRGVLRWLKAMRNGGEGVEDGEWMERVEGFLSHWSRGLGARGHQVEVKEPRRSRVAAGRGAEAESCGQGGTGGES